MKNIKLVVSDLDETLLNDNREISDYSKEVILKIMNAGIEFVVNTSRPLSLIPKWLKEQKQIRYIVTANGSTVTSNHTEEVLLSNTLSLSKAKKIIQKGEGLNPYWTLVIDGKFYSHQTILDDAQALDITGKYLESIQRDRIIVQDKTFLEKYPEETQVQKIHFITKDMKKRQELIDLLSPIENIYIGSSAPINIEITHPQATKGQATKWIMNQLNCHEDETIVCGDNANDESMFEVAHHSIAVANATEKIKSMATYHALDHDEDGVAKMLYQIIFED